MIGLDNLVLLKKPPLPSTIYHFNRYKSATISAGLAPGKTIGDGIQAMQQIADKLLDETFATHWLVMPGFPGKFKQYVFAFFLALGFIFLILAAQFESFIDPFIIMVTVPLAIAGASIIHLDIWSNP